MQVFIRQCERDGLHHLAALVLFMSQTGARISEAIRVEWRDVDLNGRTAILLKTKTTTNSVRHLTDEMVSRMRFLSAAKSPDDRVFRYTSRHSVNERIIAVCLRAGISYKSPMMCGRHAFATNAISSGVDIKTAMEAGDWKSSTVFLETYVHTRNAGRTVADRFNLLSFDADL
jgi:integrase